MNLLRLLTKVLILFAAMLICAVALAAIFGGVVEFFILLHGWITWTLT